MLFLPKGLMGAEAGDADDIASEFQEAMRLVGKTTQHQWIQDAVSSPGFFQDSVTRLRTNGVEALLGQTSGAVKPNLTAGSINADLFSIPYNRGYVDIDDTDVTWTSEYPELVWAILSFQYVTAREPGGGDANDTFLREGFQPRGNVRMAIDDVLQPGAGIYQIPIETTYRGDGTASRAEASIIVAIAHLPPGTHTVKGVAAQSVGLEILDADDEQENDGSTYVDVNARSGVYVGSREMAVFTFAMGGRLGA